nr:hypothetical protein [Tanacetum cinerariifolium]
MYVIEHPLLVAPATNSVANVLAEWNAIYDAYNEVSCLILGSMNPELHRQFENSSPYDMIQELKSMFEKQTRVERPTGTSWLYATTRYYIGLILNGLTKYFVGFMRNYNMHNMGKTIGELHALLIEYENGLPKKAETPQVMIIKGGKIHKSNKKSLKAKGNGKVNGKGKDKQVYIPKPKNLKPAVKEHPAKDDTCHHCKEVGHWKRNCPDYLAELLKKKKQVSSTSSSDNCHYASSIAGGVVSVHRLVENRFVKCFTDYGILVSKNNVFYFNVIPSNGIYEIGILKSTDQFVSCLSGMMIRKSFPHCLRRATDLLGIIHTEVCGPLRHVSRQGASYFITFTDDYSHYGYVYLLKHKHEQLTPPYTPQHNDVSERRNRTLLDMVRSMMNLTTLPLSFWDYALESATRILNMVPIKKVDKTPYELWGYYFYLLPENKIVVARYAEFFKKNLITQEVSERAKDLEEIQDEDTSPSEITSEIPMEVEGFKPPQKEVIPICRSVRTHRAPDRLCLNVEVEEHSLGDLNEPDNMVWVLVHLPPNCKTVWSKWIFKKKTDMDGIVHTYKARLVAKGYTQLYEVDYEETFLPAADTRAIRILISIAAFCDYKIWQMDVKTTFLNGYLDEDIYMVQPEGFVDPNHPKKVCKLQRSIYGLKQPSRS